MPDFTNLLHCMKQTPEFSDWANILPAQIDNGLSPQRWGDLAQWQQVLSNLPTLNPSVLKFDSSVAIGTDKDCSDETRSLLKKNLMGLHPWRKGPFELFGISIDTEWRSDWKWDRLRPHLPDLQGQQILDVGCGNGYHCLRMFGAGASRVIGIDPSPRFVFQFYALRHFFPQIPVDVLPLGIEHMPKNLHCFDSVFSMGVIYHRRDPQAHINELISCLKPGGTLILETLIINSQCSETLIPEKRYAKMRNVWCIPSPEQVICWLSECGLKNVRLVDNSVTTINEQRKTEWMTFESLADFLDPQDQSLTIEGHPAPRRGIFIAEHH